MAVQVDFRIAPEDQFTLFDPSTKKNKTVTYFTLLAKIRGAVGGSTVGDGFSPSITGPLDNQLIVYNSQEDQWENRTVGIFNRLIVSGQTDVVASSLTNSLTFVAGTGVTIATNATTDTITINSTVGTVTSVNMSVPTGFAISGNPVTTSGTLALGFDTGYSLPTDATQATWTAAYNETITSAAFDTANGVITLTKRDTNTITVDIDGRFIPLSQRAAANGVATLDGGGKVPVSQLPSSVFLYLGTWNASTNTPTLADGTGTSGDVYRVSVAGTQNLGSGNISFEIGDLCIYDGADWQKSDSTDAVTSVNGLTGTVVLDIDDIDDVNISSIADGQYLTYQASTGNWVNTTQPTADPASNVLIACKNTSGSTINKGTPVYKTGTVGATSVIEVAPAEAGNSAKMPAVGLLTGDLVQNGTGYVIVTGELLNLITSPIDGSTPSINDTIYVKSSGGLTLTKPQGSTNLIQNMGLVGKVSTGNSGSLTVSSIMRSNDVPNLPTGKVWVGTATNTAASSFIHLDEANNRLGVNTSSPSKTLEVDGDISINTSSGNKGIRIITEATAEGYLIFGDADDNSMGGIAYNNNTNALSIDANNAERITILSSGNVGIGTNNPQEKLEVAGNVKLTGSIMDIRLIESDTTNVNSLIRQQTGLFRIDTISDDENTITRRFTIDNSDGQVQLNSYGSGTHTGTAAYTLQVDSSGNIIEGSTSGGGTVTGSGTATRVAFWSGTTALSSDANLYWDNTNDRLGIGTTDPTVKLAVEENVNLSASILVNNPNTGTGARANLILTSDSARIDMYATSAAYNGVTSWADAGVINTSSATSGGLILNSQSGGIKFQQGTSEKMRITSDGNVGIGGSPATVTHNPHLDIVGNRGTLTVGTGYFEDNGSTNFLNGARPLAFGTGGTERMRIDSNGNFGFNVVPENSSGTWRNFELGGGNLANRESGANDLMVGTGYVFKTDNSEVYKNTESVSRIFFNNDETRFQRAASGTAGTAISWSESVRIDSAGNVGIGITPTEKFSVNAGTANNVARFYSSDDTAQIIIKDDDTTMYFGVRNSTAFITPTGGTPQDGLVVDTNGNVGIGNTNPSTKLHVTGTAKFTGDTSIGTTSSAFLELLRAGSNYIAASNASGELVFRTGGSTAALTLNASQNATFAGVISAAGGNAAAPSIIFEGNTDTGFFHPATDEIGFSTAGSERMRIDSSGNVGIGTTSPTGDLTVGSTTTSSGDIHLRTSKTAVTLTPSNTDAGGFDIDTGWVSGGQGPMTFSIGGSERMRISSTGAVKLSAYGGGTITGTPAKSLAVDSSGNVIERTLGVNGSGAATRVAFWDGTNSISSSANLYWDNSNNILELADNSKVAFGADNDLRILHDGTDSFISNVTGNLTIQNQSNDSDIIFRSDDGSGGLATYFYLDGTAGLTKFSIATRHLDSVRAYFGQGNDLQIYHDGSNSHIKTSSSSTGDLFITSQGTNHDLYLQAADDIYLRPQGTENGVVIVGNGDVTLYYDNAAKLSTTSTGVTVTGNVDIINSSSTTAGPTLKLDATAKATWDIGDIIGEVDFFTSDTSGNAPYSAGFIQVQNDIDGGTLPSGRLVFGTSTYNGPSGAVERMRIDSAGNVGIGTTDPSAKLEVVQAAGSIAQNIINEGEVAFRLSTVVENTTVNTVVFRQGIYHNTTENATIAFGRGNNTTGGFITFQTNNGTTALTLDSSQKATFAGDIEVNAVEVNIDSATHATLTLDRASTSYDNNIMFKTAADTKFRIWQDGDADYLYIRDDDNATNMVTFKKGGNVGIGSTDPTSKLNVYTSTGRNFEVDQSSSNVTTLKNDYHLRLQASGGYNLQFYTGASAAERMVIDSAGAIKFNAYDSTNNTGTPTYLLGTDGSGNIVKTLSTPGVIPTQPNLKSKAYTSLAGSPSSGSWFDIFTITDAMGPVNCKIFTYAHDALEFSVAEGYGPSNAGTITVINSVNTANGGYATVSEVRIDQNGVVSIKLVWISGPSVNIGISISGYNVPNLTSTLSVNTSTVTVVDSVNVDVTGIVRSKKQLRAGSNVLFDTSGDSYINGGDLGVGTTNPSAKINIANSTNQNGGTIENSSASFDQTGLLVNNTSSTSGELFRLRSSGSNKFIVSGSGNVGINDTSSGSVASNYSPKLLVGGSIVARSLTSNASMISIGGDATSAFISAGKQDGSLTSRPLRIEVGSTEAMRIDSTGELQLTQSNAEFDFTSSSSSGYKTTFNMDDTGLDIGHNSSVRALNLQTNSTDRLTITGAGNVGIGNTSPSFLLDLASLDEENPTDFIRFGPNNGNSAGTSDDLGTGIVWKPNYTGYTKRSAGIVQIGEGNYFRSGLGFFTNGTANATTDWSERMRISMDGNVGIGTDSPAELLEVAGNAMLDASSARLKIKGGTTGTNAGIDWTFNSNTTQYAKLELDYNTRTTTGFLIDSGYPMTLDYSSSRFAIRYNGTEQMRIETTGDVGINITNPNAKLHVDEPSTSANSLTYGAAAGQIFTNENSEFAFGLLNASPYPLYIQGRTHTNSARNISFQALGGNIGVGTYSPDGKLTISGGGISTAPTISVINTSSSTFNHSINAFAPNLTSGESNILIFGRAGSTKNSAYIGYRYSGTAGSNNNLLILGHWASDNLMTISGDGKVGIGTGTTAASEKLDVAGNIHLSSNQAYISFNTSASSGHPKIKMESDGDFSFLNTAGSSLMRIENGGNVGIGATDPNVKFEVNGPSLGTSINNTASQALFRASNSNNSQLYIQDYRTSAGSDWTSASKRIQMKIDSTWMGWMQFNGTGNNGGISWGTGTSTTQANITEKMILKSNGKLGLGTTPDRFLSVQSTDSVVARFTNPSNQMLIDLECAASAGSNGLRFAEGGTVKMCMTYIPSIDGIQFGTSHVTGTEKMVVRENGRVGIATNNPSYPLHVNSAVSNVSIYASADIAAFSDARVKDNIINISDPIEKIKAIRGVTYQRTDLDSEKRFMGVIAQEVLPHVPEVVHEDEKGMYSVSYQNMVALLIEGMKEQQEQIDELKEQVKKLSK